jgi:queuine tRNA-ribosyltransferase
VSSLNFRIEKKLKDKLGRVGVISTPHGEIQTPAFIVVGTKATVKSLAPEQVRDLGAQAVLANTYHLYLEPGSNLIREMGGLHKTMNWSGPTFTDSGGFQVFSMGAAYGNNITKIAKSEIVDEDVMSSHNGLVKIDDDGVTFSSHIDGSQHRLDPEKSMEIQHDLGADIVFAFDECSSPNAPYEYQKRALERTHSWAIRSLERHEELNKNQRNKQALFGIVQGGRFEDLRKESARNISSMNFDGFGVGGSFVKEDINTAVAWVNATLPEEKPRHLLGIGEPLDFFGAIENGVDTFDCVAPTRIARNGGLYTKDGRIGILNQKFRKSLEPIGEGCKCYTCQNYTKAYLSHLFRSKEILGYTLASIHNLYFIVHLVDDIRQSILDDRFFEFRDSFVNRYM